MGQARHCARVWSTKTLATPRASLLRFLHVGAVISALLVNAVPAVAGWRLPACRTQTEKPPDHKPGLCRSPARLNRTEQHLHPTTRHNPAVGIRHLMPSSALGALFQETGLIGHHHTAGVTERIQHIPPQHIAYL